MDAMMAGFPDGPWKSYPVLLTRLLIEPHSVQDLGLDHQVSRRARLSFAAIIGTALGIDRVVRLVFPDFSISRLITRVIGYRVTCALLMSQTRELAVPASLRPGIRALIAQWGRDPKASSRMNAIEDRLTTKGDWEMPRSTAPR
jgi:hypothetical protein